MCSVTTSPEDTILVPLSTVMGAFIATLPPGRPVIITSQLSRECEKREDKKPIIEDFSNSKNAIDKYADKILFLYRDSYYNKENKSDITDVIIAKNFDGMLDTIKVAWMSEYCMFGNTIVIEEEPDGE